MKMNHQDWGVFETVMKLMIVLSVFVYASSATEYTVGGESGWALASDVQAWSSSRTFSVGDTLVFVYKPVHNVLEVNAFAYNACTLDNPINVTDGTNTTVTLDTLGTRYFICGTQGHCSSGLKVKVVVNSTDSSGSGDSSITDGRRPPPSVRSPPSPRQSPPPPSNTPGSTPGIDVPFPEPPAGPNGCPSSATKTTHQFIITSVISLVLIKLLIIY
ncbi:hypothetical protein MKX01_032658 [Papaver californicum]|nr:hypothetical protein MKX01_032658 [Papaver californicum]